MFHVEQFRTLIIRPTLQELGLHSPAAENLLLGTAAAESLLGTYLAQHPAGPAQGVYQMEPATEEDIWLNYLHYRPELASKVTETGRLDPPVRSEDSVHSLRYATAMARVHYLRVPQALPDAGDLYGLAHYWKDHYNTSLGAGSVDKFLRAWDECVTQRE